MPLPSFNPVVNPFYSGTIFDSVAASSNATLPVAGLSQITLQALGFNAGNVAVKGSMDQGEWVTLRSTNLNTGTAGAAILSADGLYTVNVDGLIAVQFVFTKSSESAFSLYWGGISHL